MRTYLTYALVLYSFLLNFSHCEAYSSEYLDIETLPIHRTKKYEADGFKKIIIFSAPRTGSSLTYNIFRFIFEEDSKLFSHHNDFSQDRLVLKTHKHDALNEVKEKDVLYIFTIRNPLEACISNARICPRVIKDQQAFAKELLNRHKRAILLCNQLQLQGRKVAWLKYEEFSKDLDILFRFIESYFQISIVNEDRQLMAEGYSKENISLATQHLSNFNEYLPISGFHGLHIHSGDYHPSDDFLFWLNLYLEDLKPLFRDYGYYTIHNKYLL